MTLTTTSPQSMRFANAILQRSAVVLLRDFAVNQMKVVPTTMPGAFFWRNKGFEEHARDIGLAGVVDLGVVERGH